jgi:hypothetical protein
LAIGYLKRFNLAPLGEVTGDLQKSAERAVLSSECRDDRARPKLGSIFSDSPALIRALALLRRRTKHMPWLVAHPRFRRIKNRIVFTDNLLRLVSLDALRPSIPADDIPLGAQKKNGIILYPRDQGLEVPFALTRGLSSE